MIQKYWGICFLPSMLFIWLCASILFGLSVASMGGLTWIIRQQGLAIFSWVVGQCFAGAGLGGCVRVLGGHLLPLEPMRVEMGLG